VILDLGGNKLGHEYLWRKRGGHGGGGQKCGHWVRKSGAGAIFWWTAHLEPSRAVVNY
jgi:hypothetical protein